MNSHRAPYEANSRNTARGTPLENRPSRTHLNRYPPASVPEPGTSTVSPSATSTAGAATHAGIQSRRGAHRAGAGELATLSHAAAAAATAARTTISFAITPIAASTAASHHWRRTVASHTP